MKTHITIEYMVKRKRKRLSRSVSRSVLAGIEGGLMKTRGGVNHNDLQTAETVY